MNKVLMTIFLCNLISCINGSNKEMELIRLRRGVYCLRHTCRFFDLDPTLTDDGGVKFIFLDNAYGHWNTEGRQAEYVYLQIKNELIKIPAKDDNTYILKGDLGRAALYGQIDKVIIYNKAIGQRQAQALERYYKEKVMESTSFSCCC